MKHALWNRLPTIGVVAGMLSVAAGLAVAEPESSSARSVAPDSVASATIPAPPRALDDLSEAFATVAARVKPSVVYITATQNARTAQAERMPQLPPEFRDFFDMPGMPGLPPDGEQRSAPRARGSGSGFIISSDGYILTNNHVVDGADRVTVRLLDRREFEAKVLGGDPDTDVALLKIDATGLSAATLGNSDAARVGEWVLAVGNPLGENLTFTVTSGIISAKGRALDLPNSSARSIQDFIQTDAAINPGNSGGPLVNIRGEVIGINTAIASPTGSYAGYGFAVPINLARQVKEHLAEHGKVERAALGISVRDASPDDAAYVGLPSARGVVVQDFSADDSPAQKAGLLPGDVIIAVDGEPVEYVSQLQERIAFRAPGEVVALDVARKDGKRATVRVPLERVPEEGESVAETGEASHEDADRGAAVAPLGISVQSLDDATARRFEIPADARGLVVTDVAEDGPASDNLTPLRRGGPDVILAVEGTTVRTPAELRAALERATGGDVVTLRVYHAPSQTRRVERVRLTE